MTRPPRNPYAWPTPGVAEPLIDLGGGAPPAPGTATLVQLVGAPGAGKTTTLRRWADEGGAPYWYAPVDTGSVLSRGRRRQRPPLAPLACWDEADRVPARTRRRMLTLAARQRATIVVGVHRSLAAEAVVAGLAVDTRSLRRPDPDLVVRWARARVGAWAPDQVDRLVPDHATAESLLAQCAPNWRHLADALHAWAAPRLGAP